MDLIYEVTVSTGKVYKLGCVMGATHGDIIN